MNKADESKKLKKHKKNKIENDFSNQNQNTKHCNDPKPSTSLLTGDNIDKAASLPIPNEDKSLLNEKSFQEQFNIQTNNATEFIEKLPEELIKINLNKTVNEIKEIDSKCDYDKCKAKTTLIGQDCEFCKKRFCFKHNLAEVHGCADAIKRAERKTFLKPVTGKQKNEEKDIAAAKKRLEAKLKNMKVARMQKLNNSKKK